MGGALSGPRGMCGYSGFLRALHGDSVREITI